MFFYKVKKTRFYLQINVFNMYDLNGQNTRRIIECRQ